MLGLVIFVVGVIAGLGALWAWALYGMAEDVALAWGITTSVLCIGGGMIATMP